MYLATAISAWLRVCQATGLIAPFPSPVPAGFDVWLLSASSARVSGTGGFAATLRIDYPASQQGFGVDDSGTAIVLAGRQTLLFYNTIGTVGVVFGLKIGDRGPFTQIGMRLPRSPTLALVFTSTSTATATFDLHLVMGLFPSSLGQDVVV